MSTRVRLSIALLIGIFLGWGVPAGIHGILAGYQRSIRGRMVADLNFWKASIEDYRSVTGREPLITGGIDRVANEVRARTGRTLPTIDVFGKPYSLANGSRGVIVFSIGTDGALVEAEGQGAALNSARDAKADVPSQGAASSAGDRRGR